MNKKNSNIEDEPFHIPYIYFIETSKSEEEFHSRLAKIIFMIPNFNKEELEYLSEVVSKPWAKSRGRPYNEEREDEIRALYFNLKENNQEPKSEKEFINLVAAKYGLIFDTARKAVNKAFPKEQKKDDYDNFFNL